MIILKWRNCRPWQRQYEIRGLSEIFFDSVIETYDKRLNIEDYNLIRADQPGNKKGACMYQL